MKLKRLLSASLLLAALASAAAAQQKPLMFRQGDAIKGPVKSTRSERADFRRVDGVLVEGPRRLISVSNYTADGRHQEEESYAADGSVRSRSVHVYDDAGNEIDLSIFDGKGAMKMRRVYRPDARELLIFNGDGSLRERSVTLVRADGTHAETRKYDGGGALVERSVNERDGKTSVWSTYRADGSLKKQDVYSLDYGGPHHSETQTFAPDGSAVSRRVSDVDAKVTDLRATEERGDGGPPRKTRETREYDSLRNLSKLTHYRWNAETNGYEPTAVSYHTITYYR